MKKLEVCFFKNEIYGHGLVEEEITNFIEKSKKKTNKWWQGLATFNQNFKNHIEYIKRSFTEDLGATSSNAKTCPAIGKGLLDKVFLIKAPCDIYFEWNENEYKWLAKNTDVTIQAHNKNQYTSNNDVWENFMNLKICLPISVRTDNVPYIFLDPQYHNNNLPYKVAQGLIELKHSKLQQLNINLMFDTNAKEKEYLIKAGDVICYLLPFDELELKYNSKLPFFKKREFWERN